MILVIGGTKGGSGKSMIAGNLAVIRSLEGRDVLLIDSDEQESTMEFTHQRLERTNGKAGYTAIQSYEGDVRAQVQSLAPKYDDIVIDVGGRDTISQRAAIIVADTLVMPFPPDSVDVWTDINVIEMLKEARPFNPELKVYAFLNRAYPNGSDNAETADILQESYEDGIHYWEYLDTPIGRRKVFPKAFGQGYAVTEFTPKDKKAIDEIMALYLHAFNTISAQKLRKVSA